MASCAVIFVGLGSLTECAETDRIAWNSAFQAHGMRWEWSWDAYAELRRHGGDRSPADRFAEFIGEDIDVPRLRETYQRSFAARMSAGARVRTGVAETLVWAARQSIGIGFVSRSAADLVHPVLAGTARSRAGVEFDTVVPAGVAERAAPYPDAIELAMANLGATDGVVIADTPANAAAGLDAGLDTVAFPGLLAEDWHFPDGVIGPTAPSPELLSRLLDTALRTAAE